MLSALLSSPTPTNTVHLAGLANDDGIGMPLCMVLVAGWEKEIGVVGASPILLALKAGKMHCKTRS